MADAAITIDGLEPLQISLQFPAQIAFDQHFVAGNGLDDLVDLVRGEILRAQVRVDVRLLEDALRGARPDAVDVGQRRFDAFVRRNFNSQKSWHIKSWLSLPLFVPGVSADDADNILPLHDLARYTKSFY